MARIQSLGPALSYAESAQIFLAKVWAFVIAALLKLQFPDAAKQAVLLRFLYGQKDAARTGKSGLSRAVRTALKAAENKASLVLAEVKSYLLDHGKVEEARSLPKRSRGGLEARKARLQHLLNVALQYPALAGGDVKDLGARLQAVYAAEDAVPALGKDSKPMTAELQAQLRDLVERSASFVEICRKVAFLVGDPKLAEGAPVEPDSRKKRGNKAEKAQDAAADQKADAKDKTADAAAEAKKDAAKK